MHGSVEGLLHEASSLRRFVEFLAALCEERQQSQTYLDTSDEFFGYVRDLAGQTLSYLDSFVQEALRSRRRLPRRRRKLVAIKKFWEVLHRFVKPAADAHTLKIPIPLLQLVHSQLQSVPRLSTPRIVTLLSSDLNYVQYQHGELRKVAAWFRETVTTARDFPRGLGFIAIPYSQAASLFTNLLIYHELGHFVFEERFSDTSPLAAKIDRSLSSTFGKDLSSLSDEDRSWLTDRLAQWSEELFCDLFALGLIGPAFSLASVELFNLLSLLEAPVALCFSESHPSVACRFKEHLRLLTRHGWWAAIRGLQTEHVEIIRQLGRLPERRYTLVLDDGSVVNDPRPVQAFLRLRPSVRRLAAGALGSARAPVEDFKRYDRAIRACLSHGVVPSAVGGRHRGPPPSPAAVLNASFCFYLDALASLIKRAGRKSESTKDRARFSGRVEMWTMKALEDYHLRIESQTLT